MMPPRESPEVGEPPFDPGNEGGGAGSGAGSLGIPRPPASPDAVSELFHQGEQALQNARFDQARNVFAAAIALAPGNPRLHFKLAMALLGLGDYTAEVIALDRALELDPYYYLARLAKGSALERLGRPQTAALAFKEALETLPREEDIPDRLKSAVAHAREAVQANAAAYEAFLFDRVRKHRSGLPAQDTARFDECFELVTGKAKAFVSKPTLLHFPRLPAIPFFDNADFPGLAQLETASEAIRAELKVAMAEAVSDFKPYVTHRKDVPPAQWADLNHSTRWSAFYLWTDGGAIPRHQILCPKTSSALAAVPIIEVGGFAPTAFFSTLAPKTHIPPHTGSTNVRLIGHLPLMVPEPCRFRVANEIREWRFGRAWIFDDTIEHEAWNDSDELRVILIFDVWNPLLTEIERRLVATLLQAMKVFSEGTAPGA